MYEYLHFTIKLGLFVHDVLLDELFFCLAEVEVVHLRLKHIPCFFALPLICLQFAVARLYIRLCTLSLFLHLFSDIAGTSFFFLASRSCFISLFCAGRHLLLLLLRLLVPGQQYNQTRNKSS